MFWLSDGEEIMTLAFFVLIQYRSFFDSILGFLTRYSILDKKKPSIDRQTDRRTDGQTDGHSSSGYTSAMHSLLC